MKNFILIFLIFFSFDSMSQEIRKISYYTESMSWDYLYSPSLGWYEGRNLTEEDVITLEITDDNTIPDGHVKLMLSKTSNVSWWKGVYCEKNPYCLQEGEYLLQVWDNGDNDERVKVDGPQTFVAPLKFFQKQKLQLAKAKNFGIFTGMYPINPRKKGDFNNVPSTDGWEAGKAYHFIWEADTK